MDKKTLIILIFGLTINTIFGKTQNSNSNYQQQGTQPNYQSEESQQEKQIGRGHIFEYSYSTAHDPTKVAETKMVVGTHQHNLESMMNFDGQANPLPSPSQHQHQHYNHQQTSNQQQQHHHHDHDHQQQQQQPQQSTSQSQHYNAPSKSVSSSASAPIINYQRSPSPDYFPGFTSDFFRDFQPVANMRQSFDYSNNNKNNNDDDDEQSQQSSNNFRQPAWFTSNSYQEPASTNRMGDSFPVSSSDPRLKVNKENIGRENNSGKPWGKKISYVFKDPNSPNSYMEMTEVKMSMNKQNDQPENSKKSGFYPINHDKN